MPKREKHGGTRKFAGRFLQVSKVRPAAFSIPEQNSFAKIFTRDWLYKAVLYTIYAQSCFVLGYNTTSLDRIIALLPQLRARLPHDTVKSMTTLTIPRTITRGQDLIVLPRAEYEQLTKKIRLKIIREYTPTAAERRDLTQARKEYLQGKFLTLDEVKRKLGIVH